jgi:hypothetical protein
MHFWSRSAGARVRGVRWPGRRGETAVALSVGALPAARPNPKPGSSEPRPVSAPVSPVMTGSPLTAAFDWLDDWQMSRRSRWPTRASWRPPTELLSPAVPMELSCSRGVLTVSSLTGRAVPAVVELHGLTLVGDADEQSLWVADPAVKLSSGRPELQAREELPGRVVEIDLAGRVRRELSLPPGDRYDGDRYQPTRVAVFRLGGSGDIWVADGYGASLVDRFSADATYIATLDGVDGDGRFQVPHDVSSIDAVRRRCSTSPTTATAASRSSIWMAGSSGSSVTAISSLRAS